MWLGYISSDPLVQGAFVLASGVAFVVWLVLHYAWKSEERQKPMQSEVENLRKELGDRQAKIYTQIDEINKLKNERTSK